MFSDNRILEHTDAPPLTIRSIEQTPSAIQIRLGNTSPSARVHVMAVRFIPAFHPFFDLVYTTKPGLFYKKHNPAVSHYITQRDIGDEYRYNYLDISFPVFYALLKAGLQPAFQCRRVANPWRAMLENLWAST